MLTHHWHTTLGDAVAVAKQQGRPILSLRLLGRLDEELSCANSRFFRTTLYPDARVSRMLAERFVLHWQSVRPVPIITIDFGDGRTFQRTITGNSAHLILDPLGHPVDALPGLFDAPTFVRLASAAADLATADPTPPRLVAWHRARRESLVRAWGAEVGSTPRTCAASRPSATTPPGPSSPPPARAPPCPATSARSPAAFRRRARRVPSP